jgi:hypothetical protein
MHSLAAPTPEFSEWSATWPTPADVRRLPLFWSDAELAPLKSSMTHPAVLRFRADVKRVFEAVIQPVVNAAGGAPSFSAPAVGNLQATYLYAVAVVSSRSHEVALSDGATSTLLAPLATLLPAAPSTHPDATAAMQRTCGPLGEYARPFKDETERPCVCVVATRSLSAGDTLAVAHAAPHPSGLLWAVYGAMPRCCDAWLNE